MSSHSKRKHEGRNKSKHKDYDSRETREEKTFSFNDHKRRLNFILQNYDLLHREDEKEFWLFVLKIEKKFSMQSKIVENRCQNSICFNLNIPERETKIKKEKLSKPLNDLDDHAIQIFLNIFEAFLNFKQIKRFQQLKKIRKAQRELPVANYEHEIIETVENNKVVIIAGDTGCGKSTQIPQYLLHHKFGNVVCTQPRRLACTSLCARLKYETLTRHRNEIGYQIRFEKKRNKDTKVLFLTEGLLLRQISSDPSLLNHDVIILDEIHERHIETDFLLGLLKCILAKRVEVKIVLMSATINVELFSNYFGNEAKILKIPGRCYPVQVMYRPIPVIDKELNKKKQKINLSSYLQIVQIVDEKYKNEKGDVLIFVSGMFEIERLVEAINEYSESKNGGWIVLPLHSSLSAAEQDKVFDYAPEGYRKCIISTNIAETSVTIDGIRFVIDSGKAKEMSYDSVFKIQRLQEFWVSRSSAEQRKGRAGRTGPGLCYRLYSEEDYSSFEDYTTPEIKRAPLDSVLLQVIAMGLPDVRKFPFLEEPKKEEIENCIISLKFQNALKEDEKITEVGKMLSNLPVDLTIGKMLIIGAVFEKAEATVALASVLSVPSPYTNRAFRNLDCESERKEFESDHGDGITLVNLFSQWLRLKKDRENTKHWCRKAGLEEQRFYEMVKLRDQFREILIDKELLETKGESISASERKIRHGEIRLLKRMRSTRQEEHQNRKKLKINADEEEVNDEFDSKDIEFRLRNDRSKIIDILDSIRNDFRKNLTLMKIIYCSGLYPQFAIGDEFNHIKTEQIFHTKSKSHVFLHPLSFFGLHPEVLKIEDQDLVIPNNKTQYKGKHFSPKHKTLCYLNLLETNKIYLTNMIRMPALQSFVFFAKNVDVSFDCTRIICDNWVLFEILNGRQADVFLTELIRLRKVWNKWINSKLLKNDLERDYRDPTNDITKFFNSDICYAYKRLLPADLKYLYVKRKSFFEMEENFFDKDFPPEENASKGGTKVTEFLTYDCVSDGSYDKEPFECDVCHLEFEFDCFERMGHRSKCKKTDTLHDPVSLQSQGKKMNAVEFHCGTCNKVYYMTSVEALRHKKNCKS